MEQRRNARAEKTKYRREKPTDQLHCPGRFPRAKIRERPRRESNPAPLDRKRSAVHSRGLVWHSESGWGGERVHKAERGDSRSASAPPEVKLVQTPLSECGGGVGEARRDVLPRRLGGQTLAEGRGCFDQEASRSARVQFLHGVSKYRFTTPCTRPLAAMRDATLSWSGVDKYQSTCGVEFHVTHTLGKVSSTWPMPHTQAMQLIRLPIYTTLCYSSLPGTPLFIPLEAECPVQGEWVKPLQQHIIVAQPKGGETGYPGEKPPTSGIVYSTISTCENPGATPPGFEHVMAPNKRKLIGHILEMYCSVRQQCRQLLEAVIRRIGFFFSTVSSSPVRELGLASISPALAPAPCAPAYLELFSTSEVEKCWCDKTYIVTLIQCAIAASRKALNWCTVIVLAFIIPQLVDVIVAKFDESTLRFRLQVAERLARPPPTKANRAQSPARSPDFRKWESCRTMPLVGGFSRGSPVSPSPSFRHRSIFTSITPASALKTSLLRAAQISSLHPERMKYHSIALTTHRSMRRLTNLSLAIYILCLLFLSMLCCKTSRRPESRRCLSTRVSGPMIDISKRARGPHCDATASGGLTSTPRRQATVVAVA
ncbi:hypothetical protein PR048_025425 [Dryococelus australis]|uniref:Uncharacterized protein n=1 Tax=Dryococelus australis TaxID=614101 RepID=A0ABQ9GR89_9NEOP|nr:hypothetical protein PR048_025425 [Dryococelus australis]